MNKNKNNKTTRQKNNRETPPDLQPLRFSFKHLQEKPPGQTLDDWLNCGLLEKLSFIVRKIAGMGISQAQQDDLIVLYRKFPDKNNTDFKRPTELQGEEFENWGTIRQLGHQKYRAAGVLAGNTFYIVFLDKEHRFWISER